MTQTTAQSPIEEISTDGKLTPEDIHRILTEQLTETGDAKVKSGALFIQIAETSTWQRAGDVADSAKAQEAVNEYFAQTGYTTDF